jgi:hypothetical protein
LFVRFIFITGFEGVMVCQYSRGIPLSSIKCLIGMSSLTLRHVLIGMSRLNMLIGKLGRNGVSSDRVYYAGQQYNKKEPLWEACDSPP